jgi:Ca-activated chloride channel family protein
MAGPQTAIGDAIGVAIKMTEDSKAPERVLVLLTDGNDTASRLPPEKAAAIAKDRNITIHTIGIGDPTASGEDKVDLAALQRIAQATGGQAFRGEDRAGLEVIYASIDRLAPDEAKRLEYRPKLELFWIPLGAAAVLAALYHAMALLGVAMRRTRMATS